MQAFIIVSIIAVVLIALVFYRIDMMAKKHMDARGEEAKHSFLNLYMQGIKRGDIGEMETAVGFMVMYCPHSCDECKRTRGCPNCSDQFGWRSNLLDKYGKVVIANDLPKATEETV